MCTAECITVELTGNEHSGTAVLYHHRNRDDLFAGGEGAGGGGGKGDLARKPGLSASVHLGKENT